MGMGNVILALSEADGLCCIIHLSCQLKVLRRHKMLIKLKPQLALPKIKIMFGGIRASIN